MSVLMTSGIELMLVGMGTVFVFLTLLVAATTLMSRIVTRWWPEEAELPDPGMARPGATSYESSDTEEVAAIAAAIALHRSRQSRR